MRRFLIIAAVVLFIVVLTAGEVLAASGEWPALPISGKNLRGQGFYLSWLKILACWAIFLLWVKTTDWVNIDCQELRAWITCVGIRLYSAPSWPLLCSPG